jgi:hypothetical protein
MTSVSEPPPLINCDSCGVPNSIEDWHCTKCSAPLPRARASTAIAAEQVAPTSEEATKHSGCLTAFLIYLMFSGAVILLAFFTQPTGGRSTTDQSVLTLAALAIGFADFAAPIGIWRWKKWGVYLCVMSAGVRIGVVFLLGYSVFSAIGALLTLGLVWVLLNPNWKHFQ